MFSVSIMGFSGMLGIVVLSENISDIAMWVKDQHGHHICTRSNSKVIYLLNSIGAGLRFWCLPVWLKSKMTDICLRSNNELVLFVLISVRFNTVRNNNS